MDVRGPLSLRARLKSHYDNPRRTNARRGRRSKEIDMTTINDRRTAIVQGGLLAADAAQWPSPARHRRRMRAAAHCAMR
jgi:hypothetical protein